MPQNKIYKTVRQYNKKPLQTEDMCKLQEIARDYAYVKNCTYQRYSGVGGLLKIYPGYTVQNEMTKSGIREQVKLPSVYFYCAVFEALGDIKTQWTNTKSSVLSFSRFVSVRSASWLGNCCSICGPRFCRAWCLWGRTGSASSCPAKQPKNPFPAPLANFCVKSYMHRIDKPESV